MKDCGHCLLIIRVNLKNNCQTWALHKHTSSVSCVTCASSSFSPLAGVEGAGIFLADEGLDVGVDDLGVVELDLDAPAAGKRLITQQFALSWECTQDNNHKSCWCKK